MICAWLGKNIFCTLILKSHDVNTKTVYNAKVHIHTYIQYSMLYITIYIFEVTYMTYFSVLSLLSTISYISFFSTFCGIALLFRNY